MPQPFVFSTISAVFLKMVLLLPFGHSAVCEPFSLAGNLFLPFLGSYTPFPPFPLAITVLVVITGFALKINFNFYSSLCI